MSVFLERYFEIKKRIKNMDNKMTIYELIIHMHNIMHRHMLPISILFYLVSLGHPNFNITLFL